MKKSELLRALQSEIRRHDFSTFVENHPPSLAEGGKGVVVPGCPACRRRINTMAQFLDHLCNDVLPPLLDKLSGASDNKENVAPHSTDQSVSDSSRVRSS